MTDDLVAQLRKWAFKFCGKGEQEDFASNAMSEAADRIEQLEKTLRYIAEIKGEIAEEPPEKIGEETHKMWISLILCAVYAEAALEKTND